MITLRFTYNPTWYNRAIKIYTWHPYTHVDLVVSRPSYEYTPPMEYYVGALPNKGVMTHRSPARDEKFMTLDVDETKVYEFAHMQVGKKYDWFGIFGLAVRDGDFQEQNKWFCSELIGAAINYASPNFFSIPVHKLTPRDIALVCKEI